MTPQDGLPLCTELRCKGMYIPEDVSPEQSLVIPGDTTHWWCEKTQATLGPDRDWVHRKVCTPSRSCFRRPGDPA